MPAARNAEVRKIPTTDEFAGMKVADLMRNRKEMTTHGRVLTDEERRELRDHGQILTPSERRQLGRELSAKETARKAGVACASSGGKQKENPHEGGSSEWWGWHEGYKTTRANQEAEKRKAPK